MKDINFELYKIFYTVGNYKNITKASNELYISQPAITQQIKKLESQLGYKLFFRTKYGVEFTNEGEKLFHDIKDSILTLEHSQERLNKFNNIINTLKISGSYSCLKLAFSPKIKSILEKYPNINIKIIRGPNSQVVNDLNKNLVDIAIINTTPTVHENINYIECGKITTTFIGSTKHFSDYEISINNITKIPLILVDKSSSTRLSFDDFLLNNSINLVPKIEVSSYEIIIDLLRQGLGIGLMNKSYVEKYIKSGELTELKHSFDFKEKKIYIAINKKNSNNKFIKDVIKILMS